MIIAALIVSVGTLLVTGLILELCAVINAPLGYQDEAGFHAMEGAGHG